MEKLNQCLGVGEDKRDHLMGSEKTEELPILDKNFIYYNQKTQLGGDLSMACTLISSLGSISSLWNYRLTDVELLDLWNYAKDNYGFQVGVGNRTQVGVKATCKWWNKTFKDMQVKYDRSELFSINTLKAMNKNYEVIVSYQADSKFNEDRDDNGIVEGKEFDKNYGHASRLTKDNMIHNSYDGNKFNVFGIRYLEDLLKNGNFYKNVYIITKKIMTQLDKDIQSVEEAIELGITNNKENLVEIKKGIYSTDVKMVLMIMRSRKIK